MAEPFWRGIDYSIDATLYHGEPAEALAQLSPSTADCIVTSPPPWIPDSTEHPEPGGAENLDAYVDAVRRVLAESYRVLADDGTLWLHLTDQYLIKTPGRPSGRHARRRPTRSGPVRVARDRITTSLPAIPLAGLPWHVAFAASDDGWTIRNAIVWHDPTAGYPAPDRLTNRYDLIFLLVKQRHYWFDHDAIANVTISASPDSSTRSSPMTAVGRNEGRPPHGNNRTQQHRGKRASGNDPKPNWSTTTAAHAAVASPSGNPGDVWSADRPAAQRTRFPIDIPLRCIAAGCRPGGTVLDPYAGTGTVGLAAQHLHRAFIGIESDPALCTVAKAQLTRDDAKWPR